MAAGTAFLTLGCGTEPPGVRLVLLLSVDTLRADRLGPHGSEQGLTPNLDALGAESTVFEAAYAPTAQTLPSVAALLTGRYPQEFGITGNLSRFPDDAETLARRFRSQGWSTSAVVSNWVLRREMGLDAGFDHFDDRLPQLEAARPMPERLGADTTDAALAALDRCFAEPDARCFLWVHYQDPHGPYTPPKELRAERMDVERGSPDGDRELPVLTRSFGSGGLPDYQHLDDRRDVAYYRAGYDAEVMYLDRQIGILLEAIRARGLWNETVVVLTADHGESLGEEDIWFGHGERLSEAQVWVPLWFRMPGKEPERRSDVASLLDVAPTLQSQVLDLPSPAGAPGRDLLAPGASERPSTVYLATLQGSRVPRIGVVEGGFKYRAELGADGSWRGRLNRRGDDSVDLTAPAPQVAGQLRERLEELLKRYAAAPAPPTALDAKDREHLEALGYLGGDEASPSDAARDGTP
ncbi:MAG: sulfatase-like hydrolase/transferase [Myxococcota bacterium]|nr:sulfatase-like hydrolase/transferase [Myxococcota bacterium]